MKHARLTSLITQSYTYVNEYDNKQIVETNGAVGEVVSGLDKGNPLSVIDVIDAEESLKLIADDEAAHAACILAMCGFRPEALGGLFHQKLAKGRTGKRLLSDGITMVTARKRQQRLEAEAKRKELRA